MAIVQIEAELWPIAAKVGIPKQRASQIKASGASALDVDDLRDIVNTQGYYDEKADHLVAAGVTFA